MQSNIEYQGLANLLAARQDAANDAYARATRTVGPDYDYSKEAAVSANGHSNDAGKLPNHPTFSNESAYHTKETPGGEWGKAVDGKDTFTPSVQMAKDSERMRGLARYMQQVEPNVVLQTPAPYRIPDGR